MNIALKNKKFAVLLLCALTVLAFLGCQTMEETISHVDSYDYKAWYFEPALARFSTPDPVAEQYPSISPYAYQVKGPIYIDLQGDSLVNAFLTSTKSLIKVDSLTVAKASE